MTGWVQPPPALNPYTTSPMVGQASAVAAYTQPTLATALSSPCNSCCSAQVTPPQQPMVCVPLTTWQALQGVTVPNNGYTTVPASSALANTVKPAAIPIASSVTMAPPVVSPLLTTLGGNRVTYSPVVPQPSVQQTNQQQQQQNQSSQVITYTINQQTNNSPVGSTAPMMPAAPITSTAVPVSYLTQPSTSAATPTVVVPATSPVLNPRGVAVPAGGDPFTHPIPEVLSPDKMAPWAYYNPSPCPQPTGTASPLPSQTLIPQAQVPEPLPEATAPTAPEPPQVAPVASTPPVLETPTTPPSAAAANPLQGDGAKGASGANNPNLPGMGDAFPLTRELVEKWKADLDDRHPVTSRRTQAANEIAIFLLQHPETTLEGQPRQILERFVNNILSTGRTGSDTDSSTAVERDMILIALKQGAFYNLPETTVQHIEHMAQHSTALHGMEQTMAQEVLAKHHAGDFTPSKEFVTTYEGRFPWVITTREQAHEAAPATKEEVPPTQANHEALYQSPNPVSASLPIGRSGAGAITAEPPQQPWYKRMFSKTPKKEQVPQTIDPNQLNPAANHMGGQRLNLVSQ